MSNQELVPIRNLPAAIEGAQLPDGLLAVRMAMQEWSTKMTAVGVAVSQIQSVMTKAMYATLSEAMASVFDEIEMEKAALLAETAESDQELEAEWSRDIAEAVRQRDAEMAEFQEKLLAATEYIRDPNSEYNRALRVMAEKRPETIEQVALFFEQLTGEDAGPHTFGSVAAGIVDWYIRQTALARIQANVAGKLFSPEDPSAKQYIRLDQAAAIVSRSKRTLENRLRKGDMPSPDIEGGGGKPHEWIWSKIRPWLEKSYDRVLPERFPDDRIP